MFMAIGNATGLVRKSSALRLTLSKRYAFTDIDQLSKLPSLDLSKLGSAQKSNNVTLFSRCRMTNSLFTWVVVVGLSFLGHTKAR